MPLKNNNTVLPLKTKRSTLVIGPNAKVATDHWGGSAALPAYYAVAPYDEICQKLEAKPTFTVGAYTHRFLTLLGHQCTAPNGNPGMRWTVYNEPPGSSDESPRKVIDQMFFSRTEMHLVDYSNPDVGEIWYADLEGSLKADEDCEYELGCVVSGTARVYVDGELVIDNATKQVAGNAFYGAATCEERGVVCLEKGLRFYPNLYFKSDAFVPGHGSLRVGGRKVIDGQQEIQKAFRLAREHEQVIICTGLNSDWETEGADRASMKLPGLLDQLIAEVTGANRNTAVVMQTGTPEEMPIKELKGFTKVHLNPGESKEFSVKELENYAASYFDEEREQWCVENGEYEVIVSNTSDLNSTTCITGSFTVDESYWWSGI
uniref:Probable beta-glucosidase I n=1 Tax=Bionectria ochroleuca TaxID=29856 RepID=A0A0B7JXE0_BIOOC